MAMEDSHHGVCGQLRGHLALQPATLVFLFFVQLLCSPLNTIALLHIIHISLRTQ